MTDNIKITTGNPYPLGCYMTGEGTANFAVVLSGDEPGGIVLYDKKTKKELRVAFRENNRIGNIYCVKITGLDTENCYYNFYQGEEEFCDPYCKVVMGNEKWGKTPKKLYSGFILEDKFKRRKCPAMINYADSVFYLIHVRGFTRHASSGVTYPGTFAGVEEKLPYLKELGVTTLELMPAYEFIELEEVKQPDEQTVVDAYKEDIPKLNYWGYKEGYYFAPKASYAEPGLNPSESFHKLVRAVHDAHMELVMQFYFPAGVKQAVILEALKFWVKEYHVDGFHLMGDNIPLALLGTEPMFANTKLIYYGFPADDIYAGIRPNYKNLAECNDEFMFNMRRFLKSDEGQLQGVLNHMKDIDNKLARVHYVTNSNGFTLMDLVSYDRKHNEPNGENNRDGNPYNASWNCGFEGPTSRKAVNRLRRRQIKNAIMLNVLSQGAPLILGGDEFGNSQKGNNNPYCLDNATTWLNWNDLEKNKDIYDFYKKVLEFRRKHKILHMDRPFRMNDYASCGFPDLSYHGEEAWKLETDILSRHFAALYAEGYGDVAENADPGDKVKNGNFIYMAFNMHWSSHTFALPKLKSGKSWKIVFNTADENMTSPIPLEDSKKLIVKDRSVVVLIGS